MSAWQRIALYWACVCATFAVYFMMMFGTLPAIAQDAGSLPLDLRLTGYSVHAARDFLAGLSEAGRTLYLGPQRRLDTAYPLLLFLIMVWSILWSTRGAQRWVAVVLIAAGAVGTLCDLGENATVAAMLRMPAEAVPDALIERANMLTRAKAFLTIGAGAAMAPFAIRRLLSRARFDRG